MTPGRFSSRASAAQSGSSRRRWPVATPAAPEQPLLQDLVGDVVRQRPRQPGRRRPFQIVLDRRARTISILSARDARVNPRIKSGDVHDGERSVYSCASPSGLCGSAGERARPAILKGLAAFRIR